MANFFGLTQKPKPKDKEFGLYYDLKEGSACDYHRVTLPLRDVGQEFTTKSNVFVFNRMCTLGPGHIAKMKAEGYKIVVDWDDYINLEPDHYLYKLFQERKYVQGALAFLEMADVVTVTTELLAAKLRPYNKNIVVIRNALPFDKLQFTISDDKTSSTPMIWAGGASHARDLSLLSGNFDSNLISIAGYEDIADTIPGTHPHTSALEWQKVKASLPDANFIKSVKDLSKYMSVYDGHSFSVAPLVNNEFNNCKSNLKVLEAGAKGIPIICSQVLPYFNPIDAPFVSYASSTWEWESEVKRYLNNPSLREDRGAALAEHVRLQYNIEDANELRRQVYESL